MRSIAGTIIICFEFLVSCYKPYTSDIESNENILVVDGQITNENVPYQIKLGYALPFYSYDQSQPVKSAKVYVADDQGNIYLFTEQENGIYLSDSLMFTGTPGRTYTLNIETPDGESYTSDPQLLNPPYTTDTVYAEPDYQKTLSRFNEILITVRGANIFTDVKVHSDTLPHFRFTSDLIIQYFYEREIPPPVLYFFYCWQTEIENPDLKLVGDNYTLNYASYKRQQIHFISDKIYFDAYYYDLGPQKPDLSYLAIVTSDRHTQIVKNRILYLNQYTLNNESYKYYKSMDEQLRSEGKLFDPIAVQLAGNIKCTTNPEKQAFGFFEASSVSHSAYIIGVRNPRTDQYPIVRTPYILPPSPNGCWINKFPPSWII